MIYDQWKTTNPADRELGQPFLCENIEWGLKHCAAQGFAQCDECAWLEHKAQIDTQKDHDEEQEQGWAP